MRRATRHRLGTALPGLLLLAVLLAHGLGTLAWLARNPFPDGFQNEFLHVGNAFDLWDAARARDGWLFRHDIAYNYWPPLFYLAPWPLLAALGETRTALVLANLGWLALALLGLYRLAGGGRAGLLAALLYALLPGVYGPLARYEPNLAQPACFALALWGLAASRGLSRPGPALGAGLALAAGLLVDRLGVLPYLLVPAGWALVRGLRRWRRGEPPPWRGLLAFLLPPLLLAGPWYASWFVHEFAEVGEQLAVGEIDSAGALTSSLPPGQLRAWLYYPLCLLDGQAGPALGLLLLAGLLARPRGPLAGSVWASWLLLALLPKKQTFYSLPLLIPLSVLGARLLLRAGPLRPLAVLLALAAGLHGYAGRLWGRGEDLLARPAPLPAAWVEPRHLLARPPADGPWLPWEDWMERIGRGEDRLVLYSEDPEVFEGYLLLGFRERLEPGRARSLLRDPVGTYEWFRASRWFLAVRQPPTAAWPEASAIRAALLREHYQLDRLPPLPRLVEEQAPFYRRAGSWELPTGSRAVLWERREELIPPPPAPG